MSATTTPRHLLRAGATPHLVDAADARPLLGAKDTRSRTGGARITTAVQFVCKRSVDIVVACVLLALLSPLFVVVAIAIWLSSPGPVIYRSQRVGLGGITFGCLKFRTMRNGADQLQAQLEQLNQAEGAVFKIHRDPRVTAVGRWLRSSGLDEAPQLFNVLRGHMSLVGPRPLPLRDCALLCNDSWRRHSVLPGITGPWQLSPVRHSEDVLAELDLAYVDHWTLWSDVRLMSRTIWYGLRRILTTDSELATGG